MYLIQRYSTPTFPSRVLNLCHRADLCNRLFVTGSFRRHSLGPTGNGANCVKKHKPTLFLEDASFGDRNSCCRSRVESAASNGLLCARSFHLLIP